MYVQEKKREAQAETERQTETDRDGGGGGHVTKPCLHYQSSMLGVFFIFINCSPPCCCCFSLKIYLFLFYVSECFACTYVCPTCVQLPQRLEKGIRTSVTGVTQVVSALWVPGAESRSSARAASTLNHGGISPALPFTFFFLQLFYFEIASLTELGTYHFGQTIWAVSIQPYPLYSPRTIDALFHAFLGP